MTRPGWLIAPILALICAAYANHFQNSFHFDDSHTIVDNPAIRTLSNVPKFFTDPSTFTVLPANRTWRPLLSTSLALDYWIGDGLNPWAFHLSTFLWFLLLVWILYRLAQRIYDRARPRSDNSLPAAAAAAWFGLHPVSAETVNYVIQRGDLYSVLGVVAGLYLYVAHPDWRKYGLYLLPVIAGQLSKPPALIFPVLLFAYLLLIENQPLRSAASAAVPAVVTSIAMLILQARMTPANFNAGAFSPYQYRITQPYVAWRYFTSLFLPVRLTADTDLAPLASALDPLALAGFAFLAAVIGCAIFLGRHERTKPIAFGLWWFLATLAPSSLFPLAEVENDHRMFFPFVGLVIAAVWSITLLWPRNSRAQAFAAAASMLALAGYAWGTHVRNQVWKDESTLWRDVTIKSPRNGRGLMNYGLTLMSAGDMPGALVYFQNALNYTPNYHILEINLGVAYGQLRNDLEAQRHFQRAVALAPQDGLPYYYYARWLDSRGRGGEALMNARNSVALNPSNPNSVTLLRRLEGDLAQAERAAAANPNAETYLDLSLRYHQARRFDDCIRTARLALAYKPDLAEAYNNIAAAYEELSQWDNAIQAASQALRLKPGFTLARNNLAWSISQKQLATARATH
jgi:protein O-mannosyl-transferase